MPWALVALGGAAGALLRHAVGQALGPGRPGTFPWHTFAVNVAGSLVLGIVLARVPADDPRHLRPLLAVGFCGGLTTFQHVWVRDGGPAAGSRVRNGRGLRGRQALRWRSWPS
ncbi:MAG TPA: CrcB family protein [Longimicrobium sp.]|nr:CrcB family protein [Longimicrobium sp.]